MLQSVLIFGKEKNTAISCFQTAFPPLFPTISSRTAQTSHSLFLGLALKCLPEVKVLWGKINPLSKQISGCLVAGLGKEMRAFEDGGSVLCFDCGGCY